ncbi:MAG: hypothetical protein F4X92_07845 [Gammaproteobacteria bacterium]|nr:hypothetical protein [Gammaproteobacteria bacterium]
MDSFPKSISDSMKVSGAMTTCSMVQFDHGNWEAAVFFEVGGKECSKDRRILKRSQSPFDVVIEADLIDHASASIYMLRFEVMTEPDNPLVGEVLLAPGLGGVHFDVLDNLTRQESLRFFFGDGAYRILFSQQTVLIDQERTGLHELLNNAVSHDALIRLTGRYDASRAMSEIVEHYACRK